MYKTIIFDFFDVVHTDPFHVWMKKYGFTRQGDVAEASRLVDRGDITMQGFYDKLSDASGIPAITIASEFQAFSKIDHQMVNFIKKLRPFYKIGLLSNAESNYLRTILTTYQLESLFDVIVISSEVQLIKPEPEVFLHILKKLEAQPTETIFIDDHEKNITAAHTLGIRGLHYRDLPGLQNDLAKLV